MLQSATVSAGYSVYQREGSPFWWIAFIDSGTLKRRAKSSGFRIDDRLGYKRALDQARRLGEDGRAAQSVAGDSRWATGWVDDWLKTKHADAARSLAAEQHRWAFVLAFLTERKIHGPGGITYQTGLDFLDWRQEHRTRGGKGGFNNALQELHLMSRMMREAVKRGFITASPLERMGIKRHKSPEKPEATDNEIAATRAELKRREGHLPIGERWMSVSFEISLHQGCRLAETSLPLANIDVEARTIRFTQKGDRTFTTRLHDGLVPLVRELKAARLERTCKLPTMASKHWHWFFKGRHDSGHHDKAVAPRLCFHCLRVTVISRMARAGVPMAQAMAFVGHADSAVHRIYQRLTAPDLAKAVEALKF